MRTMLFAAILQLSALMLTAQTEIKGKVVDDKGMPLAGATVMLNHKDGQYTDAEGFFRFLRFTGSKAEITVSFIGYEPETKTVGIPTANVIFQLQKSNHWLNEVTVSSTQATAQSPVAYNNVSRKQLNQNNLGQDVPYLLSFTPSFVATSDAGTGVGYTGFRIRGTDASRINVTINGIPYNDADEQGTYWVDIPDIASSLENIQVQRGVGTSTNGAGAFGANINLQTEKPSLKPTGEVDLSYGSFNTFKGNVKVSSGLINHHWAIDSRFSSISSNGYIDRATARLYSYFLQAGYYNANTTVKLITFGGSEKTYHAWNGVPADSLATHRTYNPCGFMGFDANGKALYYKNQTDNYLQTTYQLIGIHRFSDKFSMNAALHYTPGSGYYEEYKQNQVLAQYGLMPFNVNGTEITNSDLVRQQWMTTQFAGGVFSLNYQTEKLTAQLGGALNDYWGVHYGQVTWVKNYLGNLLPDWPYYRNHVNKWDGNFYLKLNYDILSKLNIYTDLQYRQVHYSLYGQNENWDDALNAMQPLNVDQMFHFFNPKVGLMFRPSAHHRLFVSFAVAHREPARTNYTDATAGEWPTHETLYDTEIGYKYDLPWVSLGINGYYMNYKNQLVLTGKINDIGEALTTNMPKSYRTGIELTWAIKPVSSLQWNAALTLSQNRIDNYTEYVDVYTGSDWAWNRQISNYLGNVPIAFSPSVIGNSVLSFIKHGFEADLETHWIGKQYIDNTGSNERSLNAYCFNNIRLSYLFPIKGLQKVQLSLLLNNVLNAMYISNAWTYSYYYQASTSDPLTRYNDFGYFPQAGFNCLIGLSVKF
ncbi:MAG: TonB-dependent receptor [Microbacter sp.]